MVAEQPLYVPPDITFHNITPSSPLDLGHLRLTRQKIKSAIDLGRQDIRQILVE